MNIIFRKYAVSNNGNVIEVITRDNGPQERRLVFRTVGMDRRAKKVRAREWIAANPHPDNKVYGAIVWHQTAPSQIRATSISIRIWSD